MYPGDQKLVSSDDPEHQTLWQLSGSDGKATLWRYMSCARFHSLLNRKELFFALAEDMADKYEGSVFPPHPGTHKATLQQAELTVRGLFHKSARYSLINRRIMSGNESSLIWNHCAGRERQGAAIRTSFRNLEESINAMNPELPVKFGRVRLLPHR